MPSYLSMDSFIKDYFIIFKKSETVVNNTSIYTYSQFEKIALNYKDMDSYAWRIYIDELIQTYGYHPIISASYYGEDYSFLQYSFPLPTHTNLGSVLILIDEKQLFSYFDELMQRDSIICIYDKNKNILASSSTIPYSEDEFAEKITSNLQNKDSVFQTALNSDTMLVTTSYSEVMDMNFVCIQPKKQILARVTSLKIWIFTLFFLAFGIGSFLCFYLSRKPVNSFNSIFQLIPISEKTSSNSIIQDIQQSIISLNEKNIHMSELLEQHSTHMRRIFLQRLIKGDFVQEKEATDFAQLIAETKYQNSCFQIIIFRFLSDETIDNINLQQYLSTSKLLFFEALNQHPSMPLYIDSEERSIDVLVSYPINKANNSKIYIETFIQEIRQALPPAIRNMFIPLVGNQVTCLTEVVRSHENALTLLHLPYSNAENILWYEPKQTNVCEYFFPKDFQHKLYSCINSGNKDLLHDILHTLFSQNLIKGNLPYYMHSIFLNELQSNFVLIMNQLSLTDTDYTYFSNKLAEIYDASDEKKSSLIIQMYYSLCELMRKQQREQKETLVQNIIFFIDENYMESNLSLNIIANQFHYSESYISLLLKQYKEIRFSDYVESLRLAKSKELLLQTTLTISEIAEQIGYISTNSFCRAFKRHEGCTATEFRTRNVES